MSQLGGKVRAEILQPLLSYISTVRIVFHVKKCRYTKISDLKLSESYPWAEIPKNRVSLISALMTGIFLILKCWYQSQFIFFSIFLNLVLVIF